VDRLWRRISRLMDEIFDEVEEEVDRLTRSALRRAREWAEDFFSSRALGPRHEVVEEPSELRVVVEIPGADKDRIRIHGTERRLTVEAEGPDRRYYKEIWLPCDVEPERARSTYRNGVLEVRLPKRSRGVQIRVE